jgi:hypothetical protein
VLSALPKSAHPGAKRALAEIWNAEDREHARRAAAAFKLAYGAKFSKAVAKIIDDLDELLAFYDFPAEHWVHLRTTNPIESTFATVRHRTKVTKGPGSKAAGLAMAFNSLRPPKPAGARSTPPNWSPSSAPAPASNAASSSSDTSPTTSPRRPDTYFIHGLSFTQGSCGSAVEAPLVRADLGQQGLGGWCLSRRVGLGDVGSGIENYSAVVLDSGVLGDAGAG